MSRVQMCPVMISIALHTHTHTHTHTHAHTHTHTHTHTRARALLQKLADIATVRNVMLTDAAPMPSTW
jgi:hypothetical protein